MTPKTTTLTLCLLGFVPGAFGFSSDGSSLVRSFDKTVALTNTPIIVTATFTNGGTNSLRGFFYSEQVPAGISIDTLGMKVNGSSVGDYTFEAGQGGAVYPGCTPYRWVLETPTNFSEANPIPAQGKVQITYSVTSASPGAFSLQQFSWAGFRPNVTNASFGHSEVADQQSLTFTNLLFAALAVQIAGKGTVSPNYNGQLLQIGKRFTMTAKPATGSAFTNWSGSQPTNNATLSFVMQSNLTFTANFRDALPPTVIITNPPPNARLSNAIFSFRGTAKDNGDLDRVEYQLNNGPFQTANGTSNWTATVTLPAGTNVFRVKSIDTAGNESPLATRAVFFVVPSALTLLTNGNGRITGATNSQRLEVGRGYKLTATPALRHLFAGWSGGLSSPNTVLTFLMQSNLTLQANFVTNPFVGLKGTYRGLFAETNVARNHDRSGAFMLTLAEAGTYSASFQLGAKKLSATGKFDWLGQSLLTLKPSPASNVTVVLQLDVTNLSAKVEGVASNQFWLSPLLGYRVPVYLGTNASPLMSRYTLVIPGSDDAAASPGGDGYGTVVVSKSGQLTLAGKLADDTTLNQSIPVSADGLWALYASLYSAKGSLLGWMNFSNGAASDINGKLSWIKPAVPTAKYYPRGFTNQHETVGSLYVPPGKTNQVIAVTNAVATFTGGNLLQPIANNILLTTNNKVINLSSNKLTLTPVLPTGLFNGTVTETNSGKVIPFNGVLLQKFNAGYGYFRGTNQTGEIYFGPAP